MESFFLIQEILQQGRAGGGGSSVRSVNYVWKGDITQVFIIYINVLLFLIQIFVKSLSIKTYQRDIDLRLFSILQTRSNLLKFIKNEVP